MSTTEKQLDELTGIMKEQLKWTKLAGMKQLRTVFDDNLVSEPERIAYELSDGKRSVRDIEKIAGIGRTKISTLWKKWYRIGIMEKSDKYDGGRMKRSFSLSDVGIDVAIPGNEEEIQEEFA